MKKTFLILSCVALGLISCNKTETTTETSTSTETVAGGQEAVVFKDIFGSGGGMGISMVILFIWIAVPFLLSYIKFNKKDL